jgi:hypothetical protein
MMQSIEYCKPGIQVTVNGGVGSERGTSSKSGFSAKWGEHFYGEILIEFSPSGGPLARSARTLL